MSIEVSCECGKRFTLGDQFAGKRGRCKACGRTINVPAMDHREIAEDHIPEAKIASPPQETDTRGPAMPAYPSFHRPGRIQAQKSASESFYINPRIVLFVMLVIAIPIGIYLIDQGPVKARDELEKIEPIADENIRSQITRSIQYIYAPFSNDVGIQRYKALNVVFDDPLIMTQLPDSLQIQGRTTAGLYKGQFHPRTMRFEAEIRIIGTVHKIEGSVSDVDQSLTLDGKKIN